MLTLILALIIISVFSLVLTEEVLPGFKNRIGLGNRRMVRSKYRLVDFIIYTIWKLMNCAPCLSYHLTWIIFLSLGSYLGFLVGFLSFLITKFLYLKVWGTISF